MGQIRLLGQHPIQVAQQGIDFAVVAQHPHRLRQGPAGHRVSAEASVVDRPSTGVVRVGQVLVEATQNLRSHHPLVNNRVVREGASVESYGLGCDFCIILTECLHHRISEPTAQLVELPFQGIAG